MTINFDGQAVIQVLIAQLIIFLLVMIVISIRSVRERSYHISYFTRDEKEDGTEEFHPGQTIFDCCFNLSNREALKSVQNSIEKTLNCKIIILTWTKI